jgi:hypothetical protein
MFNNYTSTYKLSFKSLENYNVIGIYGGKEDIHNAHNIHEIRFRIVDLLELTESNNNIIIVDFNLRINSQYRKVCIPESINKLTNAIGFRLKDNINLNQLFKHKKELNIPINIDIKHVDIVLRIDYGNKR